MQEGFYIERIVRIIAGSFVTRLSPSGSFSFAQLALVYRLCRAEPVSIGIYPVLPPVYHPGKTRGAALSAELLQ